MRYQNQTKPNPIGTFSKSQAKPFYIGTKEAPSDDASRASNDRKRHLQKKNFETYRLFAIQLSPFSIDFFAIFFRKFPPVHKYAFNLSVRGTCTPGLSLTTNAPS